MTCVIFSLLPSWHQRPIDNGLRDKQNNRSNIQAQLMTVNRQPVESLIGRLQVAVRHTECLTCDWFVGFRTQLPLDFFIYIVLVVRRRYQRVACFRNVNIRKRFGRANRSRVTIPQNPCLCSYSICSWTSVVPAVTAANVWVCSHFPAGPST